MKELEGICNPIISKMYQGAGLPVLTWPVAWSRMHRPEAVALAQRLRRSTKFEEQWLVLASIMSSVMLVVHSWIHGFNGFDGFKLN